MGVRLGNIDLQYQLLVIKYSHCDILIFYQKIMVGFIYNFLQILFLGTVYIVRVQDFGLF